MIPTGYSPAEVLDLQDPGDDTLCNFRYQLYYGIILLIHAIRPIDSNKYVSIYCEQHDDFLCELPNGLFDAIQVKSRRKEIGAWKITDDAILKTIHRFYKLAIQFPTYIAGFHVVSNAEYLNTQGTDERKIAQCPMKFCIAASGMPPISHSNSHIVKTYKALKKYFANNGTTTVDDAVLCNILGKISWHGAPDRDGCYDNIVARQLTQLPKVNQWTATNIHKLVRELLGTVLDASSKHIQAPDQWTTIGLANAGHTSAILHKRLVVADIKKRIESFGTNGSALASYYNAQNVPNSKVSDKNFPRITKKMAAGGIETKHIERVKNCASAADAELFELLQEQDNLDDSVIRIIRGLVETACDEAELAVTKTQDKQLYGRAMLHEVYERLRGIERCCQQETQNRKFECLLGIAGVLTEECRVWWSEEFDLNAA